MWHQMKNEQRGSEKMEKVPSFWGRMGMILVRTANRWLQKLYNQLKMRETIQNYN